MKEMIRLGVYETNSSSSHSLVKMTENQIGNIGKKKAIQAFDPCGFLQVTYPKNCDSACKVLEDYKHTRHIESRGPCTFPPQMGRL